MRRRFAHFADTDLAILTEVLVRATNEFARDLAVEALEESRRRREPSPATTADPELFELLDSMEKRIMSDPNLDAIAADWPALRDAITARVTRDTSTIATLTAELASAATSPTPMSDARAAEIDTEMKAALSSLTGVSTAVASAPGPSATATGAAPVTAATPPVGSAANPLSPATGSAGSTGAAGTGSQNAGATATTAASTGATSS